MKVRLNAETSTREIIAALLDANVNVVRFIKDLDAEAADWDVTRELAAHFAEEMEKDKDENDPPAAPPPIKIGDHVTARITGIVTAVAGASVEIERDEHDRMIWIRAEHVTRVGEVRP